MKKAIRVSLFILLVLLAALTVLIALYIKYNDAAQNSAISFELEGDGIVV